MLRFHETDLDWLLILPEPISLQIGKSDLQAQTSQNVERSANDFLKVEITHPRITGHTANIGATDFNVALSKRRANQMRSLQRSSRTALATAISNVSASGPLTRLRPTTPAPHAHKIVTRRSSRFQARSR